MSQDSCLTPQTVLLLSKVQPPHGLLDRIGNLTLDHAANVLDAHEDVGDVVFLGLPRTALAALARAWRNLDDEPLKEVLPTLVADVFGGADGELHALTGVEGAGWPGRREHLQ